MAIYYFHLCDGVDILLDPEGRSVDDEAAIPDLALRDARSIISDGARMGAIDLRLFIQVRDASGAVVHELKFGDAVKIGG